MAEITFFGKEIQTRERSVSIGSPRVASILKSCVLNSSTQWREADTVIAPSTHFVMFALDLA